MMKWRFKDLFYYRDNIDVCQEEFRLNVMGMQVNADLLINTFRGEECLEIKASQHDAKYSLEGQLLAYKRAGYYASILLTQEIYDDMAEYIDQLCEEHNCSLFIVRPDRDIKRLYTGDIEDDNAVDIRTNISIEQELIDEMSSSMGFSVDEKLVKEMESSFSM